MAVFTALATAHRRTAGALAVFTALATAYRRTAGALAVFTALATTRSTRSDLRSIDEPSPANDGSLENTSEKREFETEERIRHGGARTWPTRSLFTHAGGIRAHYG
ncbi:hypothetical protein DQW50_02900 [Halorubrum sp. 48-1-W]|nr:hypothetical protein DQW50_02900 [Halorubrum sp. 48-1-W]